MNKATPDHEGRSGKVARHIFFEDPFFEEGDRDGWYRQWTATAERVAGYADESARAGHAISASDDYLRASSYYRAAYVVLFGSPVDPRLVEAFDKETDAFQKAAALMTLPVEPVEIPFEGTTLPGYFCRVDDSGRSRSTLVCTNGYDSTIYEMYLDFGTALRRGYNLLLFDGPGQGRPLIEQGLVMRPDWENVVRPVVDYALTRPEVDPKRIALMVWSFGGYLAPRAASGEHRLAACLADPGLWDLLEAAKARFSALPKDVLERRPNVDTEVLEPFVEHIQATPALRWAIIQRAFWVHGINSVSEYLKLTEDYSLKEAVSQIRCPTLLTWAESDP